MSLADVMYKEKRDEMGWGMAPKNLIQFKAQPISSGVKLRWEAGHTVVDGQTIVETKGIMFRRKEDSYPTNIFDGVLVTDTEVLEGTYEDTGLTNGVTYYYTAFPYSANGVFNANGGNRVTEEHPNRSVVTPQATKLYGFKRAKANSNPASRITYTDGAVGLTPASANNTSGAVSLGGWSDAWFVTGNKPCMMKYDGTIDYYLDPDDYTKKEDGTASDVANTAYDGNAMAIIPLVWVKRWSDSTYDYVQFSDVQLDDDFHAYAHQRADGTIMDWFARSLFDGSVVNNILHSFSGLAPCNTVAGGTQLDYAYQNGELWNSDTYSRVMLLWDLLTLMGKSDDLQGTWGKGYDSGMSQASHLKNSGQGLTKGQFYGKPSTSDVVKVFHIENLWGNLWKIMQGLLTNGSVKYLVKMTAPYNDTGKKYHQMTFGPTGTSGGYQSAHNTDEYGTLPTTVSGSSTTYIPDGCWFAANCFARFGGAGGYGLLCGRALGLHAALSYSSWAYGVALTCEQPAAA